MRDTGALSSSRMVVGAISVTVILGIIFPGRMTVAGFLFPVALN